MNDDTSAIQPAASMLTETSDRGFVPTRTRFLVSAVAADVVAHAKKGGTTAGFSFTYAVNPSTKSVVCIVKKGHVCQKDIKPFLENGYTEWHYSWAFAGKTWRFTDGTTVKVVDHDLVKMKDVLPWARALGYVA